MNYSLLTFARITKPEPTNSKLECIINLFQLRAEKMLSCNKKEHSASANSAKAVALSPGGEHISYKMPYLLSLLQCHSLVSYNIQKKAYFPTLRKVKTDPRSTSGSGSTPKINQKKLTTSTESPVTHASHVWSTCSWVIVQRQNEQSYNSYKLHCGCVAINSSSTPPRRKFSGAPQVGDSIRFHRLQCGSARTS